MTDIIGVAEFDERATNRPSLKKTPSLASIGWLTTHDFAFSYEEIFRESLPDFTGFGGAKDDRIADSRASFGIPDCER
jgi:hypothetical protein